jgi:methionyl-tRNA formyltransferase
MKVQLLADNPRSWIIPYAERLRDQLRESGVNVRLLHKHEEVEQGEILCLLSCEKIFKDLRLNKHNLVVHESDLPKGKGWSPLTWQVLEGKHEIPVTLFEAVEQVDAGPIYGQEILQLDGTELLDELKHMQGEATLKLILDFIHKYPEVTGREQVGESSFYKKRGPSDSELDVNKTLAEQFDLLRVCDNERYPAFFTYRGKKYKLKIYEYEKQSN